MERYGQLKKQFSEGQFKKFLRRIRINNLHGWNDSTIEFRFPVCAIVGENGIGKSTFLKAAACAYENEKGNNFYPSRMYVNTQWDKKSIENAEIYYKIIEGGDEKDTHWKKSKEWGYSPKGKKPKRNVFLFDVSRVLPLDATAGYAKIALQSNKEISNEVLKDDELKSLSEIMSRNYKNARFTNTEIYSEKTIGILTNDFGDVSQFHQGAGEDATFDLFKVFQNIPEQSLLIIDELEASLHPSAQRKLTRYLIELSRKKKVQVIISTHSPYVLNEIPEEGRVLLFKTFDKKEIIYNPSTDFALSTIDSNSHPELYIFTEDKEASTLVKSIIRKIDSQNMIMPRVSFRDLGDYNVVKTIGKLLYNKKLPYDGIAFVDGDASIDDGINKYYYKLPNDLPPEKFVFTDLKNMGWNKLSEKFGMGASELYQIFNDALTISDHHEYTNYIGDKIYKAKESVWEIFCEEWVDKCADNELIDSIVSPIKEKLKIV